MRIAMIGTKGVPAQWGGIECYIEAIGKRLVERGHEVTVFGSKWFLKNYRQDTYCGIQIRRVPTIHCQATDALSNAFLSTLYIARGNYDLIHFHAYASYFFVPIVKNLGIKTVVTTHNLIDSEWKNPKYGRFATLVSKHAWDIGVRRADCVATVAEFQKVRIKQEYQRDAYFLPSGVDRGEQYKPDIISKKYSLKTGNYILFLGRIDPIKRIELIINLSEVCGDKKIVVAGGAQDNTTKAYFDQLHKLAHGKKNIIFTGPVIGQEKVELLSNCILFINPSSSEGLPIAVLEAMSYGRCCVASDISGHREVISNGKTGFLFSSKYEAGLIELVSDLINSSEQLKNIGQMAKKFVVSNYNWDRTVTMTEKMYRKVIDE